MLNLIRQGKRSKEIAEMLNIALQTVETHRKNIRKKLNISGKKINLVSYLNQSK
ncbi:MAG: DNA-binding response regulator [Candidatus Electrothrix sp. AR4]|nr:DNA-binding response regulator [Candidatus Electrothrix sp. AR4]